METLAWEKYLRNKLSHKCNGETKDKSQLLIKADPGAPLFRELGFSQSSLVCCNSSFSFDLFGICVDWLTLRRTPKYFQHQLYI